MDALVGQPQYGTIQSGRIELDGESNWPDGMRVRIMPLPAPKHNGRPNGHVIIVGFGLAGRCVADLLCAAGIPFVIVEKNASTVQTQLALGRKAVVGDAITAETLTEAGLHNASTLALTIPDEEAVLNAITLARRLRPEIYIIARTNYASQGMLAAQLGADDVIKAEQAVAVQFYERLSARLAPVLETNGRA
ncbi:MAG: NAD-binding protein [Planctomycetes bacterium]|nr:NAD-binding protein [Planctomycetota bacterium]MBI3833325.1 NAD-binding protein [Planctomycetota bacterium]